MRVVWRAEKGSVGVFSHMHWYSDKRAESLIPGHFIVCSKDMGQNALGVLMDSILDHIPISPIPKERKSSLHSEFWSKAER